MDLGKSLRVALAIEGIRQSELASLLSISRQQVSNWVNSGRISARYQNAICKALGMKLSEFIALGE